MFRSSLLIFTLPFYLLLLCNSATHAEVMNISEALELGKSLGSENQVGLQSLSMSQNADGVPGYQGIDIPQAQYANNPMALEDEARLQVNQNDTGSFVSDSVVSRPQFQFDKESDPLLMRSQTIQEDPESVAGSIEAEYSGCQSSTITTSPGTSTEIIDCGSQTICLDGACFDASYEPSKDFGRAAASLGALGEAGDDFDVETNRLFKGSDLRCSKAIVGFSNCCKVDGWGQDIGLDQCNSNEQRLALSRKGGLCHYVGSYCSNKTLFGCTSRGYSYCCFKSKLARIIHQQGRIQLGLGWGSAKRPNCEGITIEQLQSLDFSLIDFSEVYADSIGNANSPGSSELQGILKSYIEQAYR